MGDEPKFWRKDWRPILDAAGTVSVIGLCATLMWATIATTSRPTVQRPSPARPSPPREAPLPSEPLSLEGSVLKGSKTAKIAVIEYSDFQCPYCGAFARDTLPTLEQKYVQSGKVLVAFREFPLEAIHPFALGAAQAAECASRQGQFWQMHDALFGSQQQLGEDSLLARGLALHLDADQFRACLRGQATDKIRSDEAGGRALAVSGTPTFFVGTVQPDGRIRVLHRLVGGTLSQFQEVLDRVLASERTVGSK